MKIINSALVAAAFLSSAVEAQGKGNRLFDQSCQVTYNEAADKYMGVRGMECDAGLVCAELNDNGQYGVIFTGRCKKEECEGKADPNETPTPKQETSSHRVTICHRTCSETNPWVRITIDDDAWGGPDASGCGHQREHNVTQDCKKDDYSAWGPNRVDYLIKDHGTRADVRADKNFATAADEKKYWFYWERACPYVRAKRGRNVCCDWDSDECCGVDPLDECPMDPDKDKPGVCGCGVPDTDTDENGTPDCKESAPTIALTRESAQIFDECPNDPAKTTAGHCGCGVSEVDTDGDGTPDCKDECPEDKNKLSPLVCGCGVADDDSDSDGTHDCNDKCPKDMVKLEPGVCGCGVPDTDSDLDGTPDCKDECPRDPSKIKGGVCGCGVSDMDTDKDGTPDCQDLCKDDPSKIAPGLCGCGKGDSDNDGTCDEKDQCPTDPMKNETGQCGCGVADTDSDVDGVADCKDGCSLDYNKTNPEICGCGVPETDSDKDGTPDCNDGCPTDATKIAPGTCGCGVSDEVDSDGDGTPDCIDYCPDDPNKIIGGTCGCGESDMDSDGDRTSDCQDSCSNDPNKISPGKCGCGIPDTDTDMDGTPDCTDFCRDDPGKTDPGVCGCGISDFDTDGDGIPDCNDECPGDTDTDTDGDGVPDCIDGCFEDPEKIAPGLCGCGSPDVDSDDDGVLDCNDGCKDDAKKTEPGTCGCGVSEMDTDKDGTLDCMDECPKDIYKTKPGICGCGTQDTDTDKDGTPDCKDICPMDASITADYDVDTDEDGTLDCNDRCPEDADKVLPGVCGCGIRDVDDNEDGTMDCKEAQEDITLETSNLIATTTTDTYTKCFDMYNAGNSDNATFSGYAVVATAYCLPLCDARKYCVKVQAAYGIQLADKEAWFKDYSYSTSGLQPSEPAGIKLTYDNGGKVTAWEGCFEIPTGADGSNIEIHANWGYLKGNKVGNTASTGKPTGVKYPECLSAETVPKEPETTTVTPPVETESVTVTPPSGADIDKDPDVGLPEANQEGDGESGGGFGDPHLKTWMGEVYDFHGACDLILVKTPTFHNGAGLDVHIRTKIRDDWSFISDTAIRIGDDVLEVGTRAYYYVNGVAGAEMPNTLGGFPVSLTHFGTKRHKFEIDLGHMGVIVVKVFNEFLAVEVDNAHSDGFGDSVGLMGTFTDGSLLGRNGNVQADHNEFGLSWQVHDTDMNLFQKVEGPQYPQLCQMPAPMALKSRRMSESLVSFEDAAVACADWDEETRESCIYDVMSTGDLDMAEAGAF